MQASKQALTVFLQHEVHIRNGAQPQRVLAVADAVDVLRDLLHPLVQPDGFAQLIFLTNVPDTRRKVGGQMMSWQQGKQSSELRKRQLSKLPSICSCLCSTTLFANFADQTRMLRGRAALCPARKIPLAMPPLYTSIGW